MRYRVGGLVQPVDEEPEHDPLAADHNLVNVRRNPTRKQCGLAVDNRLGPVAGFVGLLVSAPANLRVKQECESGEFTRGERVAKPLRDFRRRQRARHDGSLARSADETVGCARIDSGALPRSASRWCNVGNEPSQRGEDGDAGGGGEAEREALLDCGDAAEVADGDRDCRRENEYHEQDVDALVVDEPLQRRLDAQPDDRGAQQCDEHGVGAPRAPGA